MTCSAVKVTSRRQNTHGTEPSCGGIGLPAESRDRLVELLLGRLAPEVLSQVATDVVAADVLVRGLQAEFADLGDDALVRPAGAGGELARGEAPERPERDVDEPPARAEAREPDPGPQSRNAAASTT